MHIRHTFPVLFLSGVLLLLLLPAYAATPLHTTLPTAFPTQSLSHVAVASRYPFGVETNTGRLANPTVKSYAQQLGVSWVRLNTVSWLTIQPTEERVYHWESLNLFERDLLAAAQAHLTPIVVVDDSPAWATIPYVRTGTNETAHARCGAIAEEYFDDYAAFMQALVARYGAQPYNVRYWELGNEVDIDPRLLNEELQGFFGCWGNIADPWYGGEHYGRMLKVVAPAIKAIDPTARIVSAGLALDTAQTTDPDKGTPERFFEGMLRAGAGAHIDVVGFHVYPWYRQKYDKPDRYADPDVSDERWAALGGTTLGKVAFLRDVMQRYGIEDVPLFLNETALVVYQPHTNQFYTAQAEHIVRQLFRVMSVDVRVFIWYTLHESGWLSAGLLDRATTPRIAYTAYKELVTRVRRYPLPLIPHPTTPGVEAYRLANDESLLDVVWCNDAITRHVTVPREMFVAAYRYDGMRLFPTATPGSSTVAVDVTHHPTYIEQRYPPPRIEGVGTIPTDAVNTHSITLIITGSQLFPGSRVLLDDDPLPTASLVQQDATHIVATIPTGWKPGTKHVVLVYPDGNRNTMPRAITIASGVPQIDHIEPMVGSSLSANMVAVYGTGFAPGTTLTVGQTMFSTTHIADDQLLVTMPALSMSPGTYGITVTTPAGTTASLPNALSLAAQPIPPDQSDELYGAPVSIGDVFGIASRFVTVPAVPRVGEPTHIGIAIYQDNQATTHIISTTQPITVQFYANTTPLTPIGTASFDATWSRHTQPMAMVEWVPTHPGKQTLVALIDAGQHLSETNELNNMVQRDVWVETPLVLSDKRVPSITHMDIAHGMHTTSQRDVPLQLTVAYDDNIPTSPQYPALLNIVEYGYNPGTDEWLPIQQSGWLTHTGQVSYTWHLLPLPGVRYVAVWATDRYGRGTNIPAWAFINYMPPTDTIPQDVSRVYRYTLSAGDALDIALASLSGDPDVYVWRSDTPHPLIISNDYNDNEQITLVAQSDGLYQLEIHGFLADDLTVYRYEPAGYALDVAIHPNTEHYAAVTADDVPSIYEPHPGKAQRTIPVIDPAYVPVGAWRVPALPVTRQYQVYLPYVQR